MPAYTFYHPLLNQKNIVLEQDEFKHLKMVMRQKKGDHLQLIDGKGTTAIAQVKSIEKNCAQLTMLSKTKKKKPFISTTLYIAHIRPQRFDRMLEQIVALGVDSIYTFATQNANNHDYSLHQKKRHQQIIINSCKQSAQLYFPKIHYLSNIDNLNLENCFFCDPNAKKSLLYSLQETPLDKKKNIELLIGPESGFTKEERQKLKKKTTPVKLSHNIYRSELAAISAINLTTHFLLSKEEIDK